MGLEFGGLLGLLILAIDVWAIINVLGSPAGILAKALWTLVILALPVLGLIEWYFLGPRGTRIAA